MRTLLYMIGIVALVFFLFGPKTMWAEGKRMWSQRELIMRTLVIIVVVYLLYGFYAIYKQGLLWWAPGG